MIFLGTKSLPLRTGAYIPGDFYDNITLWLFEDNYYSVEHNSSH